MGIDETKKENTEARTAREKALTLSIIEKRNPEKVISERQSGVYQEGSNPWLGTGVNEDKIKYAFTLVEIRIIADILRARLPDW